MKYKGRKERGMKLIIDVNDNEYMGIKKYPNNITSYPVTIHIYDAIRKGVPLEDVLDKIRAEIEKERVEIHTISFKGEYNNLFDDGRHNGLLKALEIIDKYREERSE